MARSRSTSAARRTLIWLGVLFAVLTAALAGGVVSSQAGWAPKLALDLEGGTQMILAPKVQGAGDQISAEQLNQAVEIIRQRVDGSGVAEAEISTQSGRNVVVSLPGVPDTKTRNLIQASANMEFRPVLVSAAGSAVPKESRTPKDQLPNPTAKPKNASDENWVTAALYQEFEAKECLDPAAATETKTDDPAKPLVACEPDTGTKYILGPVEVPGTDISSASFGQVRGNQGQSLNQWAVNIEFNSEGTAAFKSVTERLFGMTGAQNQFAIVLDGQVISAPTTNAVIPDGKPQITGSFTEDSARVLSEQLKYGALPISFQIQSEQQISATLGAEQLKMGLLAGVIGLVLVAAYSFFQYRLLALVTIGSLVVAGVLTYLAIALLGWTENYRLSLAGVAGLIVAIGQTADSFIVYFERIRDELREGRGLISAVDNGWKRAKRTVLASKAVNLLAAVVLYFVSVGNVRGFAFTLGLTAVADLIVVFLFTHPVMVLLARTKFFGQGHRFSGLDPRLLGAVPLYRGAGRIRQPSEAQPKARSKNAGAAAEAVRRQTIAERKAEQQREASAVGRGADKESN
ncbi:protein translocase subunit SecD [Arthrobacter sp. I2-34]|uniref:Protein translocase subunit SecD n=1 Tax=Arthrobacter hankyongi TaxID=2904801 RepID=A0ABS9LDH0_9MICC|nr:protein translocase subunit SecD [Arthrobacter hankyongi]MCG2624621.1 protein translocase subunit SecD [Arthrobacter hankyongi]